MDLLLLEGKQSHHATQRPDQDQWHQLFVYTNIDKLFHSLPICRMLFTRISFPLTGTLKIQNVFLMLWDSCATRWSLLGCADQGGKLANTFTKFIFLVQVCQPNSMVPIRWIEVHWNQRLEVDHKIKYCRMHLKIAWNKSCTDFFF